jgi:catechol 2,3-dioxygenase-like lactoylglutathione lyase family enzyme
MAITGLHHIGILVSDLSQAETFATEVLGLSVTRRVSVPEESTDAVLLECGGVQLELIAIHDPERRARRVRIPNAPAEIDHLALAVDDIDAEARRLAGHGLKFTATPGQLVEAEEPVAIAGMRSLFSLPSTSSGLVWQLIEDRGDAGQ